MSNSNWKRAKLEAEIGSLDLYIYTGWVFSSKRGWYSLWVNPPYKLNYLEQNFSIPTVSGKCHCSTQLISHCLIMNIETNKLEFIGKNCMVNFDMNLKRCVKCRSPNKLKTEHCASCRTFCELHGLYHEDNQIHTKIIKSNPIRRDQPLKLAQKNDEHTISFGKYSGLCIDRLIGVDDDYIHWMVFSEFVNQDLKKYICESLLPRTIRLCGRYKGKTHDWIRRNDKGYYDWLKREGSGYARYL